jgi:hypothetical protein
MPVPPPAQACHSDLNENNLLVDPARSRVVGVLDWGDASITWRVTELAVALAYAMMLALGPPKGDGGSMGGSGGGGVSGDEAGGDEPLAVGRRVLVGPAALLGMGMGGADAGAAGGPARGGAEACLRPAQRYFIPAGIVDGHSFLSAPLLREMCRRTAAAVITGPKAL